MNNLIASLLIIIVFITSSINAQNVVNQWRFGRYAALDFNSGVAVPISGSSLDINEGCSSISDDAGNLLFYTDGDSVWNSTDGIMTNGMNLMGDPSASQCIIVPQPSANNMYYIFSMPSLSSDLGFYYSEVDMNANGGLGEVVLGTRATYIPTGSSERITAVEHCNGTDYWIIRHAKRSNIIYASNDSFFAFQITAAGISPTPVISKVGTAVFSVEGQIKVSPDGSKLCMATNVDSIAELFDFDNSTGVVSNPIFLKKFSRTFGVEFSGDNSKLYVSDVYPPHNIWQYDICGDSLEIVNSATIVGTISRAVNLNILFSEAMQLGPDGKIYIARFGLSPSEDQLSVINNPNEVGLACNFQDTATNGRDYKSLRITRVCTIFIL